MGRFLLQTMRHIHLLLFLATAALSGTAVAQSGKGTLTQIDVSSSTITVDVGKGQFRSYRVKLGAEITVNAQRVALKDLAPKMSVNITAGEPGTATRIVATGIGAAKPAPPESKVTIPATATPEAPIIVGLVTTGQRVTITPIKVWWTGGGSKTGIFCDWNGYPDRKQPNGKHWMALIAAVNASIYAPENNAFSFTVPSDGTLSLYANDGGPDGNKGSGEVTVTVSSK
jgi:hypothetical protein